jgi:hypothetical protein
MPNAESEIDAVFYGLIHQLSSDSAASGNVERREGRRNTFFVCQRIAPWQDNRFPDESAFFEVPCNDLSRSGFSFFLPDRPDFTSLVVELGSPPHLMYVKAEVLHLSPVLVYPSGLVEPVRQGAAAGASDQALEGERPAAMVLVGCRLTRRLQRPSS